MRANQPSLSQRITNFFGLGLELIIVMFLTRLVLDTSIRIFVPFIPQLSSGLGLSITAFSWLLAVRSLTGWISPVVGVLADRYSRRRLMAIALFIQGIGLFGLAMSTEWWSVIPMLFTGLAMTIYLPIQKAYVSDQVCYARRGRALATVDASLPTAGILGMPAVGWMIEYWGWQLPLYILSGLSFIAAVMILLRLPKTNQRTAGAAPQPKFCQLLRQPKIIVSATVSALLLFIFVLFMMFWVLWLSDDFGFGPLEIGLTATYIGAAELVGLFLAGLFIDRIGKRRGTMMGVLVGAVMFALIPFFQQTIWSIRFILVLTTIAIEFAFTAVIPLFAEQAPEARATVFSIVALGNVIGSAVAAPVTSSLWVWGGLEAIVTTGVLASLIAFLLIWKYLQDNLQESAFS